MGTFSLVPNDDTTKAAVRPSLTSVRLFNALGGVELGFRQARRKAMVFVRVRQVVIAMWWKADPGTAGRPVPGRIAVGRPKASPEVHSGYAQGLTVNGQGRSLVPGAVRGPNREPGKGPNWEPGKGQSREPGKGQSRESATPAIPARGEAVPQNAMQRLWRRVSQSSRWPSQRRPATSAEPDR